MADVPLQIQAYLILLQFILLCFTDIAFFFFQIEGLWQPRVQQVYCAISPTFAHFMSLCHSLVVDAVQSLSCVQLFANPQTAACQTSLSFTISQSLLKLMSIESMMPSSRLTLCRPLLLLTSIFPSIRVFSNELALLIRWPKYWSFSVSHSNEYSGLISFRTDWFDLFAVQKTLKSLLQHHKSKASILQHSALFIVQVSHIYMITGKTIAFTIQTFVSK